MPASARGRPSRSILNGPGTSKWQPRKIGYYNSQFQTCSLAAFKIVDKTWGNHPTQYHTVSANLPKPLLLDPCRCYSANVAITRLRNISQKTFRVKRAFSQYKLDRLWIKFKNFRKKNSSWIKTTIKFTRPNDCLIYFFMLWVLRMLDS